jgi:sialate O-acetylesterase
MVLQQNTQAAVWGWAAVGKTITINGSWGQNATTTVSASGKWATKIQTPVAIAGQAPAYTLTVTDGTTTLTYTNVLVGEVWLTTGQSNIWIQMNYYPGFYTSEINSANYPNIHFFTAPRLLSATPQTDVAASWLVTNPTNVANYAMIPYFFARELYNNTSLNVPIGILSTSYGGKGIPDFLSAEAFAANSTVDNYYSGLMSSQSQVFNGMIAAFIPFTIKGMLWYQGEANAREGSAYGNAQTTMLNDWRTKWGVDFSFYAVQVAPYLRSTDNPKDIAYVLPLFREFQNTILNTPKTGIVVNTDEMLDSAELLNIHPHCKIKVAQRLAALALAKDYGQTVQCEGPTFLSQVIEGGKIRINFKTETIGTGLTTKDGKYPSNFRIAGSDKKYYPALATIDGNTVIVSSLFVPNPVNLRYAYSNGAMTNLQNAEGFPAFPFRTDTYAGWTGATYIDMPYPISTGLNNSIALKINLFPNPANDLLHLTFENNDIQQIEILDFTGKVVFSKNNIETASENVNVSKFAQGIYLLKYQQKDGAWGSTKFVKE